MNNARGASQLKKEKKRNTKRGCGSRCGHGRRSKRSLSEHLDHVHVWTFCILTLLFFLTS